MGVTRKRHDAGTFNLHVRKGDMVLVLSGADAGKRGRIIQSIPQRERVIVEDVNVVTKHQRAQGRQQTAGQQGIIRKPAGIHVSNVMLVCSSCNQPTRIAHRESEGRSVRICKHCGELIAKQR
jgi:large subunit ribosomal protein L24